MASPVRTYTDRCPGVHRPWVADDGAIVRLRIPGGRVTMASLERLVRVAEVHGDGTVLLTSRANVQLRGLRLEGGSVPANVIDDLRATDLLPSDSHELVRNIVCSPGTGRLGGRADLRPIVDRLDAALVAEPDLSDLGGRFLFVLDDGRGDVAARDLDLGLTALSDRDAQVRVGAQAWGPVVDLDEAPRLIARLATTFAAVRGIGGSASWHVDELPDDARGALLELVGGARAADPRTSVRDEPLVAGTHRQRDGRVLVVLPVLDGLVTAGTVATLRDLGADDLVVTPWRSILAVDLDDRG